LTTEQLVFEDALTAEVERLAPQATRVLTYLVNETSRVGAEQASGIPYSMFSALPVDEAFTLQSAEDAAPLETPDESELILNEWAAADLQAKPGDRIRLRYFQPESTHGQQVELTTELRLKAVAKLTRPSRPFQARRSGPPVPAEFTQVPTPANDPDLTPEVPGLTDSDSIENWDLPFETTGKIRRVDDQYWDEYRTTPKGFVNPQLAERIWGSRFGRVTGFRVPLDVGEDSLRRGLQELWRERPELFGWSLLPVKRLGLQAASGSTPFDGLFLGLSLFVIASALILTSLLFRLGLDQRAQQLGLLAALGFPGKQTVGLWSVEVLLLGSCGAVLGAIAGIGYARLIIWGLQTFWVGAISRPFLQLFVDWPAVIGGTLLGLLVSWLTILWSISRAQR
ncbi:MAG: ABC transporter permease, partial [Planctomycetota bacterium]